MADIELIIKIDEEIYQEAVKSGYSHLYDEEVANAIANGIPLDKIRAEIEKEYLAEGHLSDYWDGVDKCLEIIDKHKVESEE